MKVYKDTTYKYVNIVEMDKSEIDMIDLAICKQPKETLGNFYKRQTRKPNVLINAGFFNTRSGATIFNVLDEGKVVSEVGYFQDGLGVLNDKKTLVYGSVTDKSIGFTDFVTAYPSLVVNGKSCAPWKYATEVNYKALRTMVGYNDTKIFVVMVNKPGLAFTAMANLMIRIGCKYAINLDGGGSSRCMVNGSVINIPTENRAVDSVFAFYLKSLNQSITEKPTTTTTNTTSSPSSSNDYYTYKVVKGDSWWAISARECGSGAKYTQLQKYNNWSGGSLKIGTIIKIPYTMSIKKK